MIFAAPGEKNITTQTFI